MESSSVTEDLPMLDPKAAIRELTRGRDFAARLRNLLPPGDPVAAELVEEVLSSFSRALSALESRKTTESGQDPADNGVGSPFSVSRRSEVSGWKRKLGPVRDRRGDSRNRRTQPSSWRRVTSKKIDDGYSWRKYGQKVIHSAKFPRSYFRCTHKHDQGCQATRQVQKSEEDPSLFIITYMSEHTCRDATIVPLLMKPSNPMSSRLISFGSNTQEAPLPSTHIPSKKPDFDEDVLSNLTPGSSSSEYFMLPDLAMNEGSKMMGQLVGSASDHGDVTSGLQSATGSFELCFMANSFEFEDVFDFGQEDEFFKDPRGPPI